MLQRLDDNALMLRYRDDGDMAAFETLYGRHKAPLYRYLLRQCGDADTADDLFQEAWTRVIRGREKYRPMGKFGAWLFRVARNCWIDRIRREGRNLAVADPGLAEAASDPGQSTPEQDAGAAQEAARLRVALDALSPEQREAFLLHQESGLTLAEIAGVVGVGHETIKSRLRYAVAHLRKRLAAETDELTGTAS
jgi:RNA polymerase sigma-70 factor (ECF subfamily)